MAKIATLQRPGPFKKTVAIPLPEGGTADVVFTFKYRKRSELAALQDAAVEAVRQAAADADAKAAAARAAAAPDIPADTAAPVEQAVPAASEPVEFHTKFTAALITNGAQYLVDVADGWDLAEPLTLETAREFCDLYAGAVTAVSRAYTDALTDARLGN